MHNREVAFRYDCDINKAENFLLNFEHNKIIMEVGKPKYISNKEIFTIVDSFKTGGVGFGSMLGGGGVKMVVLKNNNHSYVIPKSNLEYGEIK